MKSHANIAAHRLAQIVAAITKVARIERYECALRSNARQCGSL